MIESESEILAKGIVKATRRIIRTTAAYILIAVGIGQILANLYMDWLYS